MKFGEWTKISDELPPEPTRYGDYYLVTVASEQVVPMRYVKEVVRGKEVIRWLFNGRIAPWDVIAYMPFPEAFKE